MSPLMVILADRMGFAKREIQRFCKTTERSSIKPPSGVEARACHLNSLRPKPWRSPCMRARPCQGKSVHVAESEACAKTGVMGHSRTQVAVSLMGES